LLLNERYIGRFVWNKRKFVRVPGKKNRRAVERPASEWRILDRPELAIIEAATWAKVQERFASHRQDCSAGGRPLGAGRHSHLFSGIARCSCGAGMGVTSQHLKAGVRYVQMGCAAHASRGNAICSNALTVSERKLNAAILGALRDELLVPGLLRRFVERVNERVASNRAKPDQEVARLDRGIQEAERGIRNLTDSLVQIGFSEAVRERLQEEERRLVDLRSARMSLARPAPTAKPPSGAQVEGYVRDLLGTLEADPERGRDLLRRHLGTVTLTPRIEGARRYYHAAGAFDLSVALDPENGTAPEESPGAKYA